MTVKWSTKYERKPGRWIFEPTLEYRDIGALIKNATRKVWKVPLYYFHLRSGGHVKALEIHAKNVYFVRFDIEDFFGHVTQTRITRCLKTFFGYPKARQMAKDSTVQHPIEKNRWVLPYGFVQSPILASLALAKSRLGTALDTLHKERDFKVSVYMDDIIVSCNDLKKLEAICDTLMCAAKKSEFAFNSAKCEGPATAITAFNIELTHANLAIVAIRLGEFALEMGTGSEQQRRGILSYVKSVNSDQADRLRV